jgi:hypothetical protein
MLQRCTNPNHPEYKNYGGRGIKVCDRWLESFEENFLADMGLRPSPKLTLDRIDNNKGYSKSNCRWATPKEQARNRRPNRVIPFNGEMLCVAAVAEHVGIKADTLRMRLNNGWPLACALGRETTPCVT